MIAFEYVSSTCGPGVSTGQYHDHVKFLDKTVLDINSVSALSKLVETMISLDNLNLNWTTTPPKM